MKNFLVNEENVRRPNEYKDEEFDEKNPEMKEFYKNFNLNNNNINNSDDLENSEEMYLSIYKNLGLYGGPSYPYEGFPDFKKCSEYLKSNYQPIYFKLKNFINIENEKQFIDKGESIPKSFEDDEKENKYFCDDIFALFLLEISKKVIPKFYRIIVIFIRFYRECMNKLGWEILNQFKDLEDEPTYLDFCTIKNGEYLPQISNDFINLFIYNKCPEFDKNIAVVLLSHFCHWLFKNNHTHIKINMVKSN